MVPFQQPTRTIGIPRAPFRDFYHAYLRMPWWWALSIIVAVYLALNALFAIAFLLVGGVAGADEGSMTDAFYFSIQTMGTIGYGAMYPVSPGANALVAVESVVGLLVTAVSTGLVFSKFSRSTARIVFTREAVIAPMDGAPTLMFRIGNERGNLIMEAQLRVSLVRTEHTKEGQLFYRLYDVQLVRDRSQALARSWTVMHTIGPTSPLFGQTPATLKRDEVELLVSVAGTDDTSLQPVHARKTYTDAEILWGKRHADILSEDPDGTLIVDLRNFHETIETIATPDFPYPVPG
jgi:inward rectifier potassium channel